VKFSADENGQVLRRLFEAGDDLSAPRDVDFSVVFPDEACAAAFVGLARGRGLTAELGDDVPGDVTVSRRMIPDHAGLAAFETELEVLAAPLGGCNDGWGCWGI
jgi:hypothetical protein